jgi:four helix bundle protein
MFTYEKLEVYRKAYTVNQQIYRFLKEKNNIPRYTKDQLGRASLSMMLNIAEGSAKFSNRDRRNFYITARGSAFECAALIHFLSEEQEISNDFKSEILGYYEEVSKILFTMIKNISDNPKFSK